MRAIGLLTFLFFLHATRGPAQDSAAKDYPPAYLAKLGEAMQRFASRDFSAAKELVEKADATHTTTPMSLNIRGAIAIEERQFDVGRKLCLEALEKEPRFFPARFNLAEIPFVQGKYVEARSLFEKLIVEFPKNDLLQFRIYLTYLLEKDDAVAKATLNDIPFLSDSPIYYYSQAAWEFAHGNEQAAKDWLERAAFVFPAPKRQNFQDVFYDIGWMKRPEVAAQPSEAGTQ